MRKTASGVTGPAAAFTIAELLIAVAITSLIVVMLAQVFSSASAMWQTADQRIDAFRDARSALQTMAVDFGRANVNGDAKMLTLAQYSADGSYAGEADVITPIKNSGKSDLCAVEYYLNWNGATNTYALMRRIKNSDATSGYLATPTPDFTKIYDRDNTKSTEEILSTPVWDLQFRPGEKDNVVRPTTDSAAQWKWLEIRFKTMSVNSARKLKSRPDIGQATWNDPTTATYKTLILPYEQQFVTRVSFFQNQ
jgi:type II secretory pathway component PulJ